MENFNIKTMKLYNNVDRIYNELREIGKENTDSLLVEELVDFDQLHYHGTKAIDISINKLNIQPKMSILEIGSGIGGPARYIANKTGAKVTALELQPDQNTLASELTNRCGLSKNVIHICGDFLKYDWKGQKFDAIVSWLTLYHIHEHDKMLQMCFNLLNPKGSFYLEDLLSRRPLNKEELSDLLINIYAKHLSDYQTYKSKVKQIGFNIIFCQNMYSDWKKFTRDRIIVFKRKKDRHIRVHGKEIFNSLNSFYSFIYNYFSKGKIGGIRLYAKKP